MKSLITRSVRQLIAECRSLYDWWLQELREFQQLALARVAPDRASRAVIELRRDGGILKLTGRNRNQEVVDFPFSPAENAISPEVVARLPRGASVHVCLHDSRVLVRDLSVPAAAERSIRRVIELQLERQLPCPVEQLYTDWRTEGRVPEESRLNVTIAAAKRVEVDAIRESLNAHGLRVTGIGLPATTSNSLRFDFLPRRGRASGGARVTGVDRFLLASALVLCLSLATLIAGQAVYERHRLSAVADEERERAANAAEYQDQLTEIGEPFKALQTLAQHPSGAEIVLTLTDSVPADSWVYLLEASSAPDARGGAVAKLSALTPTATSLADLLEKAPAFEEVRLVTATSAGIGTGLDRVELSLHIVSDAGETLSRGGPQ